MRALTLEGAHALAVLLLPLVVCGNGLIVSLLAVIAVALIGMAIRFYLLTVGGRRKPKLQGITYSHYVERVRWAMQRVGMDFEEEQAAGILGILLLGRTVPRLIIPAQRTSIGDSTAILKYIWATYQGTKEEDKADFLKVTPEIEELSKKIDRAFGLHSRRWLYYHTLKVPAIGKFVWGMRETRNVPAWQRLVVRYGYQPLRYVLTKMLGVSRSNARKSLAIVKELYDELDALFADGRPYICGDHFTIADITLASLGALTTLPEGYTGGAAEHALLSIDDMKAMGVDLAFVEEIQSFRQRPTGRHILRMYAQERSHVMQSSSAASSTSEPVSASASAPTQQLPSSSTTSTSTTSEHDLHGKNTSTDAAKSEQHTPAPNTQTDSSDGEGSRDAKKDL
ncbi:hypothetical protein PTSG_06373 [Salpingoeca rosetta]|uniref:GST C-terminal domain-containing protein n=1 Tax=Salpingoeca rosetta (strain ATCC 50818 / BSB-021) TaxID=946362 RepID=F2UCQ5_SALR5|nr:uncharacterized protein PTSG_06373 [Salpingoeca rosetta]EGD74362.1 hypothetical protein PTSG_06373 [Salpingoeca rosetta]|eukprot:XP_004993262.1 hypothetical protein PTSG_06373 [Salpingoeca rosetta]